MRTTVRKIGNSRGVLIPASFLAACEIESEIELHLDGKQIVIAPLRVPRSGWFKGYQAGSDDDAWADLVGIEREDEDWQW